MINTELFASDIGTVGLGLRKSFLTELINLDPKPIDFLEVVPENWLGIGGRHKRLFTHYAEVYPIICHGLSLSIGSIAPVDIDFVKKLKSFFKEYNICLYSEHLSYCSDKQGFLYDLMPMPFTSEAVYYVANRIKQVQDILEQRIALENISYYACLNNELSEIEFINAVITEANCMLLLDINNIYVNSINHGYDPVEFLTNIPKERVVYFHIAGHWQKEKNLIIDTHGEQITEAVWQLLNEAYGILGIIPTLLERDNNIPLLQELLNETAIIKSTQSLHQSEKIYDT